MLASGWSSLEVTKVVLSILTPLAVVGVGYYVNRSLKSIEKRQWSNQRLIERRIELHQAMAPLANDILCFFTFVGNFRNMKPNDVMRTKRELDQRFHVNRHLFSEEFASTYSEFMDTCFLEGDEAGKDAKLRSSPVKQASERGKGHWSEKWIPLFEAPLPKATVQAKYDAFMACFAKELGFGTVATAEA